MREVSLLSDAPMTGRAYNQDGARANLAGNPDDEFYRSRVIVSRENWATLLQSPLCAVVHTPGRGGIAWIRNALMKSAEVSPPGHHGGDS